jgi:hypothetical protein
MGWDWLIKFHNGNATLYSHCESFGTTEFIKDLESIEDLKETYELLTNEIFK